MFWNHKGKAMIGICCLLLLIPLSVSAEDSSEDKGKIKWDIDRIIQDQLGEDQSHSDSELEKNFPDLFKVETHTTIQSVQKDNERAMSELEESLFSSDLEADVTIDETREALFTSDYEGPKASRESNEEVKAESSWFNNLLIMGLAGFGVIVLGGIYVMFQKLFD